MHTSTPKFNGTPEIPKPSNKMFLSIGLDLLYPLNHRRQSWGLGSRPPDFGQGGRGRVIKYQYILSCTGSMFESGDFWERNRIICLEIAVNSQFLAGKSNYFVKLPKNIEICRKFAPKNRFSVKLPEKIKIFRKFSEKIEFLVKFPNKSQFFGNLAWKIEIFVKLPEKIELFRKFVVKNRFSACEIAWKNRNF